MQFIITYAPLLAMIAVVYSVLLTEPGEIFSGLYKWLEKRLMQRREYFKRHGSIYDEGQKVRVFKCVIHVKGTPFLAYKKILRDYEWIFRPLIGCERCVSGQMALWLYCPLRIYAGLAYCPFFHVAFICLTIFCSVIIKTLYLWMKKYQERN